MRRAFACAVVLVMALGLAAFAADKPADAPKKELPKEPTLEEARQRLEALPADAKLTGDLVAAFKAYAFARAKQDLAKEVPADFWTWLGSNATIREGLLVALHPDYKPGIAKRLQELRQGAQADVESHPHLALAFAVVFGRAGDKDPWGPTEKSYLRADRKPPTMLESFQYYIKYEPVMKAPLKKLPWPLLAYVVDNETPIDERIWALKAYERLQSSRFLRIYYDLDYDWGKLQGHPKIADRPRTLANLKEFGGVCIERAYFSSRVYKSFGIPAVVDAGEGQRGGHAWVAWMCSKAKGFDLEDCGRFDYDKYYTGNAWGPLVGREVLDREVQLLAVAAGGAYETWLDARIACHVYGMLKKGEGKPRIALLRDATDRNPYCSEPWHLLGESCSAGDTSPKEGEAVFESIFKSLSAYPDLTYEVLANVLKTKLEAKDPDKDEIERNLRILVRAYEVYEKAKRPDLAVNLCLLQGSYLEKVDRKDAALKIYMSASDLYANQHYGFHQLFERALVLMDGADNAKKRVVFCEAVLKKVPKQRGDVDKKLGELNPSYVLVAKACIAALKDAGMDAQAKQLEATLDKKS